MLFRSKTRATAYRTIGTATSTAAKTLAAMSQSAAAFDSRIFCQAFMCAFQDYGLPASAHEKLPATA